MLEIVLLIGLWKAMGSLVESKNRYALPFQILVPIMWFGGAIFGGAVCAVVAAFNKDNDVNKLIVYVYALAGAAISVGFLFLIAACLPEARDEDDFDEEGFRRWQEKRRKSQRKKVRRRDDDDDEDEVDDRRRHYSL
jgi:hypothetical protein